MPGEFALQSAESSERRTSSAVLCGSVEGFAASARLSMIASAVSAMSGRSSSCAAVTISRNLLDQ